MEMTAGQKAKDFGQGYREGEAVSFLRGAAS
jgi:hypothetical protein